MPTGNGFTGRTWVLDAVAAWLEGGEGRHFLLTGEPGSGKSAIARHLAAISDGAAPAHAGLGPGWLAAAHFCSARDGTSVEPRSFSRRVAEQLAALPGYAQALLAAGDREIGVDVKMTVGTAEQVVGVQIGSLVLAATDPQQTFNRLVAEPLQALYADGFTSPVTILVDGLDEALAPHGGASVVRLLARSAGLPPTVRFVLTSRRDTRVLAELGVEEGLFLSDPAHAARNDADLKRYVAARWEADPALRARPGKDAGAGAADGFAGRVAASADGNFQYAVFLLAEVAAGRRPAGSMDGLPSGLDGLYLESLSRVVDAGGRGWAAAYRPLMRVLTVARDPLTDAQLAAFSGLAESAVWDAIGDLQQFVDETEVGGAPAFRLYHQSVADFLHARRVGPARVPNPYLVVASEAHAAVADACLVRGDAWDRWDDYALRHCGAHLAGAAEQPRAGHDDRTALVELVLSPGFQAAYVDRLEDPVGLEDELERALAAAVAADPPAGPALTVQAALGVLAFTDAHLRPAPVFALARSGELDAADRRLASLRADASWRSAARLAVAWAAADAAPDAARERLERAGEDGLPAPLGELHARIGAGMAGHPWHPARPLPPAPDHVLVGQILERLGGGRSTTGIEPLSIESGISGDEAPAYLAEMDGPLLVAYAAEHPAEGDTAFRRYLEINAANAYAYYRNRSLWALLEPVVRHPDPEWTRAVLQELLVVALSPADRTAFREGLPMAAGAAWARAAGPGVLPRMHARMQEAVDAAREGEASRSRGDPWAHHIRRLGALAEIYRCLLDDGARAEQLVAEMIELSSGFAGFRYRAWLEAADAAFLAGKAPPELAKRATEEARAAAHNIQDHAFCARATARVNALEALGWPSCADAERFADSPGAPGFAAWHRVGEGYVLRDAGSTKLEIPPWARHAATPEALASLYGVPVEELLAANPAAAWAPDEVLGPDTRVHLPDPGFAPMVAARLCAAVLADPACPPARRTRAIARLAPHALADARSMDAVLSRLVMAARPEGAALRRVARAVEDAYGIQLDQL